MSTTPNWIKLFAQRADASRPCKAFDVVNHSVLLRKVSAPELPDRIHNWIVSFLIGRWQICAVNGVCSPVLPISRGIFKDQVLGQPSTLF